MTDTDVERYRKIRTMATHGSSPSERRVALDRMTAMEDKHPGIRERADAAPPPSPNRPPDPGAPFVVPDPGGYVSVLAERVYARVRERADATFQNTIESALDTVDDAIYRMLDPFADLPDEDPPMARKPTPAVRQTTSTLLQTLDYAGATFEDPDVVVITITLPLDAAQVLADRMTKAIGSRLGEYVMGTIEETLADGSSGDWPFGDDTDDDDDTDDEDED